MSQIDKGIQEDNQDERDEARQFKQFVNEGWPVLFLLRWRVLAVQSFPQGITAQIGWR